MKRKLPTGLDPARPLIKPGVANRLDIGDAKFVQVLHTNAGYYGEGGKIGHVDFCMNGGRKQPYCETTNSKGYFCRKHHSLRSFIRFCFQILIYAATFGLSVIWPRVYLTVHLLRQSHAIDVVHRDRARRLEEEPEIS